MRRRAHLPDAALRRPGMSTPTAHLTVAQAAPTIAMIIPAAAARHHLPHQAATTVAEATPAHQAATIAAVSADRARAAVAVHPVVAVDAEAVIDRR